MARLWLFPILLATSVLTRTSLQALAFENRTVPGAANLTQLQTYPSKPRVLIFSDILNEPDDSQSFVRLLLYADQLDIRGLVATTSTWLRNVTYPDEIAKIVSAYGNVTDRLNRHVHPDYPFQSADDLLSMITTGPAASLQQEWSFFKITDINARFTEEQLSMNP